MNTSDTEHYFLKGGGEMGKLIREKDWSKTPLGDPADWPQSLRTMVAVMLDNPFGMYIAWGNDFTQLYNDGYRPILGATKHPDALGISTRETFSEIWHIIESMFEGVMKGTAVGFPDLMLPLNRNGFVEDCYFDFAYSPIRKDNGEVGGVLVTVIETTEKKRATEALKESNARFINNIMQAPVAMCIFRGKNYVVEIANEQMLNLWGKHADQVMNKPIFEGLPEVKDQGLEPLLKGVFTTGEKFVANERPVNLPRNGKVETTYINFVYQALKEPEGTITGVVAIATDVTSQVVARKKIEDSETRLQLITDALPVLIAYIDKNRIYRFNNKAYETWFGHASKDITGKHIQDVLGEAAYKNLKDNIDKVLSGQPVHLEISVPYKDGGVRWVIADYIPHFGKDNEVLGYYGVVNDVTAIKEAERLNWKLAAIVQSSEDAIISKTLEGIVTSWNPGAEKIFGYSASEMIGKPIHIIVPPDRREEEPSLVEKISNGETVHHFETKRLHKDGKLIDISLTVSPIRDNEGNISGASKIARDITESVEVRKKTEQSEKQQAFLLKMSDELRPLVNPVDIEDAITKIALDFLEADRCYYCDIDEDNAIILRDAWRGDLQSVAGVHPISSFALYKAVIKAGHPFVIDDVQTSDILDEELKKVCMQFQYGSFINVPVIKDGKSVGLFSVVQCKPRKWTEAEVQLTIETAERTWAAVERANGEEALRQSEEKYRTLFNSIDQGFLRGEIIRNNEGKGIDYYVHDVNSTYEMQTGIDVELVLGKTVLQAFPTIDQWWIETYASVVDNQYPVRFEKFFEFTNRWFEIKASPAGKEMFTILFTDITESRLAVQRIKESEERFRKVADSAPVLIWMSGTDKLCYFFNKGWLNFTGRTMEEELGNKWAEGVHPDDLEKCMDIYSSSFDKREDFYMEYRLKRHDGEYRWLSDSGVPRFTSDGEFEGYIGACMDIEEQKKAEEQFRVLADQAPMWVWQTDKEVNVLYANPELLSFIGIAHYREFTGKMWERIVHPADIAMVYQSFSEAVSLQQSFSFEFRVLNALTQDYEWFYIKAVPRLESGEFKGFIGTGININEQRLILQQLEYRKALLEAHNESSLDGILLVDTKGKILSFNQRFLELWNMQEKLVDDKDDEAALAFAVTQLVNPEHFMERVRWMYENPKEISVDELEFKDGKIIERHGYHVFGGDGSHYGCSWMFRDITQHRKYERALMESEERFRSLAQTLPQLVWMTDAHGNQEFASSRWKEYTGIDTGGEKEWKKIVHPEDYDAITASWTHSLSTGTVYKADVRIKNKAGEYRWHSAIGEPVLDNENKIVKWVGAFTDIQEQKIKEEQKDEFISIASHELKTPLTTAKAYLQMLELLLDDDNEDARLYAKKANQSVNRLNELISELLDVSKIRLGKLNYTVTSFNFNDLIESTVENIQLTSQTHTIIKTGKVRDEVTGDKDRLQQVVINLLTNAVKYSPGAEKVFINLAQEKDSITLSVKDVGIGIAQKSLDKIFEKYHRVEEHAVQFQGLGIGLFISYEIIQRHNGRLWAESVPGKGSTFYFTIPLNSNLKLNT